MEQGGGLTQRAPGKDLVPVSVSFSVFGAATQCFNQEDRKTKQKVGTFRGDINVLHSRMTKTCWETLVTCF